VSLLKRKSQTILLVFLLLIISYRAAMSTDHPGLMPIEANWRLWQRVVDSGA